MVLNPPERLLERLKTLWPDEYEEILSYAARPLPDAIRVNTLKISVKKFLQITELELEKVSWYRYAFIVKNQVTLGNTLEHVLGYVYSQSLASMLPVLAMKPRKNEKILDLCAAPGSKTTQIAQHMQNTGVIVANDIHYKRLKALASNLQRCGVMNTLVIQKRGEKLYKLTNEKFDKVLVDAPCSGEGTVRKDESAWNNWSHGKVSYFSKLQKKLIVSAFNMLKPDGILLYSTCTLAPEENEGVIDYLLNKFENARLEKIRINGVKLRPGIVEFGKLRFSEEVKKCVRVLFQDLDSEGFFLAKIRKV